MSRSSTRSRTVKVVLGSLLLAAALFGPSSAKAATASAPTLAETVAEFERYSGAKLVFERVGLPQHVAWYDRMPTLTQKRRLDAARIALAEIQRLPKGYLGAIGLKTIGIFEACISKTGDGFRPYNKAYKGYVYYGVYQASALAAAYYTDGQLPLTLHHEIFHHVDSVKRGSVSYRTHFHADDARFAAAVNGKEPYPALTVSSRHLSQLRKRSGGSVLRNAVGHYASKAPGEDQAETARYIMSHLPDAIVQAATQPKLPGTQRILHVLNSYRSAAVRGPQADWFVKAALGHDAYLSELKGELSRGRSDALRAALNRSRRFGRASDALRKVQATAALKLVSQRLMPSDRGFVIHGREDRDGVNWTLRSDLAQHGQTLAAAARLTDSGTDAVGKHATRKVLKGIRLLARFHNWIASRWSVTKGTRKAFEDSIKVAANGLSVRHHKQLRRRLQSASFLQLSQDITATGEPARSLVAPAPAATARPAAPSNRYLRNVDKAIKDPALRATIRGVQPATVRVSTGGSGVNIDPRGYVLTNAHVLDYIGRKTTVTFPDGRSFAAVCTHIDAKLDVAIATIKGKHTSLPAARLAARAPTSGTRVVVIGQPGSRTPEGEATGYGPFYVSVGRIRGFLPNLLGSQSLGRVKHDAWTYWGHSGSPLFDSNGRIVAMHNSWDSTTAMRHAVPWEAIRHALKRWGMAR